MTAGAMEKRSVAKESLSRWKPARKTTPTEKRNRPSAKRANVESCMGRDSTGKSFHQQTGDNRSHQKNES